METIEERALREVRCEFVRRLNVDDYVLDYLLQEGGLTDITCEHIRKDEERSKRAAALVDSVIQKAIIPMFIEALNFRNSHTYLASLLTDKVRDLQLKQQHGNSESRFKHSANIPDFSFGSSFSDLTCPEADREGQKRTRSNSDPDDHEDPDETSVKRRCSNSVQKDRDYSTRLTCSSSNHISINVYNNKHVILSCETGKCYCKYRPQEETAESGAEDKDGVKREKKENIYPPPQRVNIMDKKKKTLTKIHYHLKLLSHDGKKREFETFVSKYKSLYCRDADIMFTLLDAEVESRRLAYDTGLHKGNIFNDMEKCIVSSSHPVANTMMFLARKGSARTMKESLEVGLDMLEEARVLSEHIEPCKDTGMVLYILINILFQIYEKNPIQETKNKIIRKIDEAINVHFANGQPFLREDYTRMLFLKMVFCYLGIGLFGNTIEQCVVSEDDLKSAETCLQIIDSSQAKFDSRRKMFYFMAKSVLHRKRGAHGDALDFANMAKRKAKQCDFKKELGPILELTDDLKQELVAKEELETQTRERDITSELHELESEGALSKYLLEKPSNQWGEPTK